MHWHSFLSQPTLHVFSPMRFSGSGGDSVKSRGQITSVFANPPETCAKKHLAHLKQELCCRREYGHMHVNRTDTLKLCPGRKDWRGLESLLLCPHPNTHTHTRWVGWGAYQAYEVWTSCVTQEMRGETLEGDCCGSACGYHHKLWRWKKVFKIGIQTLGVTEEGSHEVHIPSYFPRVGLSVICSRYPFTSPTQVYKYTNIPNMYSLSKKKQACYFCS